MAKLIPGVNDLATANHRLADEWHPTKNGELTPKMVTYGSTKKVWWLGSCGHEWEAIINSRQRHECPICSNRKVLAGFNDLATVNPELAAEWHPTKNGELTPMMVTYGSTKKVWWRGDKCGHEWEATINDRHRGGICPICNNREVLAGFNDLATANPKLAAEWHPTKNGELTPKMVTYVNTKKVWWRGDKCGHEWEAIIYDRHRGSKCPVCKNRKVLAGFNDLATVNPKLAAEWHPTKNGELTPKMVTYGSTKKVWWLGDKCGHEWEATINDRQKCGCPICDNKIVLAGFNDLATVNPKLAAEWHPTKNGEFTPKMVTARSSKYAWWRCKLGHEWESRIADRQKYGCPICDNKIVLAGFNDLATVNPKLAAEWHPTQNGTLTASMVTSGSDKKVWWRGKKCGHEWEAAIGDRNRGRCCPICNTKIVLPGFNDLVTVNPKLAAEWHPTKNGTQTASMVTPGSDKKAWWRGKKCGHEWEAIIKDRHRGSGCPICENRTHYNKKFVF